MSEHETRHKGKIYVVPEPKKPAGMGGDDLFFASSKPIEVSILMLTAVMSCKENRRYRAEIMWEIENARERIAERRK